MDPSLLCLPCLFSSSLFLPSSAFLLVSYYPPFAPQSPILSFSLTVALLLHGKFLWCHCNRQSLGLGLFSSFERTWSKVGQLIREIVCILLHLHPNWKDKNLNYGLGYKAYTVWYHLTLLPFVSRPVLNIQCFPVLLLRRMTVLTIPFE